jgi:mono/diheme cytochrome c family protein
LHSAAGSIPRDSRVLFHATSRSADRQEEGGRLFQINCAHCHGPRGAGDGPVAGYLKELPANLQASRVQGKSVEEVYRILTDGKDAMPSFRGELSADERWTIAGYVKGMRNEE